MTDLDRLPPDQRAVLSLVLERGRSYGEVAEMLAIPESAVRDRAHAALDALAQEPAGVGGPVRSAPTRSTAADTPRGVTATSLGATGATGPPPRSRGPRAPGGTASSRRAGALLLGAIVVVIVVAVVLISTSGGKGSSPSSTSTSSSTASTTTSAGQPALNKTISLTSPDPELKASGTAYVLSENGRSAFYITAQGLPPSSGFFYAVWLYNSPSSSTPLGRASNVGSDGLMKGGNPLPPNASLYHQLIVTRETSTHPSRPGPIVLRGTFALH
jgi:hypothetical protein